METSAVFVSTLVGKGVAKVDVVTLWSYMHLVPRREPVATVPACLLQEVAGNAGDFVCTPAKLSFIYDMLQARFSMFECQWDTNRPHAGGLAAFARLLRHFDAVKDYSSKVLQVRFAGWQHFAWLMYFRKNSKHSAASPLFRICPIFSRCLIFQPTVFYFSADRQSFE